jgi:hypothetical protein
MKLQIDETDSSGNTVAQLHPAPPETQEKPKPRATVDVLSERAAHLQRPLEAFCTRLDAVNVSLDFELKAKVAAVRDAWSKLASTLLGMQMAGCSCPTTPKSRKLARLRPGMRVCLTDLKAAADYRAVYGDDLDELVVDRVVGDRVSLRAGEREVGLVKVAAIAIREE